MVINFLAPYKGLSGGLRVIAAYGNALMRRGHRVTITYPRHELHWKTKLRRKVRRQFFDEKDHLDRFAGQLVEVPELSIEHISECDCLIATGWTTAVVANELPVDYAAKFYLIQGYETWDGNTEAVDATFRYPLKKIVISRWLKDVVEARCDDIDIPVIPNGRDFFLSESSGEGLNRKYDVGMIYSPVALKRAKDGIEVMRRLQETHPNLRCVMFGSEEPQESLPENIDFFERPNQEQIRRLYLSTKIWINTSTEEGFCLPVLEAMSLGTAVVTTNNKGVLDIVSDEIDGFIVPPKDVDALTEKVDMLLNHPVLMENFITAGLLKSERFSWAQSVARLEAYLYANLSFKKSMPYETEAP
ncbi:MAG: glycosyltransferase family 4 protein [Calditrichota bacterium]